MLWGAPTLNFLLPRLAPGNPVRERLLNAMAQGGAQQAGVGEMVQAYNQQFGLDKPLWFQYLAYLSNAVRLDFGYSIAEYPSRVLPMIMSALPWTIGMLVSPTLIAFAVGTLLGALIAWPRSPRILQYLVGPMMTLSAIPYYLLGLVMVYGLGVIVPLFPISAGYAVGSIPRHPTRNIRAQVLTLRERGYVQLARLSGMRTPRIVASELLPNLLPYVAASFVGAVAYAIPASIGLEALGLGPQNDPTIGMTIYLAIHFNALLRGMWWWVLPPIGVVVLLFIGCFCSPPGWTK